MTTSTPTPTNATPAEHETLKEQIAKAVADGKISVLPTVAAKGAKTMVVGVANAGGVLPDHWVTEIVAAVELDPAPTAIPVPEGIRAVPRYPDRAFDGLTEASA